MMRTIRFGVDQLGILLIMPAIVTHELAHYLVARLFTDAIRFDLRPTSAAVLIDDWHDAPRWAVWLAHVAPTVLGVALAPAVAWWLLTGRAGVAGAIVVATNWAVLTKPSKDDLSIGA